MTPPKKQKDRPPVLPDALNPLTYVPDALNPVRQLRVMGRFVRRQVKRPGTAPGTLVHTGVQKMERVRIGFLDYDEASFNEREVERIEEVLAFRDSPTVSWVNVDGLHDVELVEKIGDHFDIHPLVLEDVLHVGQRPKLEEYDAFLYLVMYMLRWDEETQQVAEEQVSLILGSNWVLSFQERHGDVFEPIRERLRAAKGRVRQRGADYLAYALMDATVDSYYSVLEEVGEFTERLELEVLEDPRPATMARLHELKRELLLVRRSIWPVREMMNSMIRTESTLVEESTKVFLRDVHDHAVQLIDTVETLRDVVSGMIDIYLSALSNRTNEVMKVLTIMASIFIPLTFVAGVYGMNFEYMPELTWRWAYPAVLGVMLVTGIGLLVWFRRKGWL